jgi:tetratricopeptide (TPR) repeat protein
MGEKALLQLAEDRNLEEAYRFTYLPSFHSPLTVRIWSTPNQEPPVQVVVKVGGGQGGYELAPSQKEMCQTVVQKDWKNLLDSIEQNFWVPSSWKEHVGFDGSEWIFEGYRVGGLYKVLTSWCGRDNFAFALGNSFCKFIPDGFGVFKDDCKSSIIDEYVNVGQLDDALECVQTIESASCKARSLNKIAAQFRKVGQLSRINETLIYAFQVAQTIEKLCDKAYVLTSIVDKYIYLEEYDQALQIAQSIEWVEHRIITLWEVSSKYAEIGQLEKASSIWTQVLEAAKTVQNKEAIHGELCKIAREYAKLGQLDQALEIVQPLRNNENVLAEIVVFLAAAGKENQAIKIVNTFEYPENKALALAGIAAKVAVAGDIERADKLLRKSFRVAQTIKRKNNKVLAEIAICAATSRLYYQAIHIANIIEPSRRKAKVLAKIAHIYSLNGCQIVLIIESISKLMDSRVDHV